MSEVPKTVGPVFITKYALTEGVIVIPAAQIQADGRLLRFRYADAIMDSYENKPHWHLSEEEALAQVVKMGEAKIASLEKERDKVRRILDRAREGKLPASKSRTERPPSDARSSKVFD